MRQFEMCIPFKQNFFNRYSCRPIIKGLAELVLF